MPEQFPVLDPRGLFVLYMAGSGVTADLVLQMRDGTTETLVSQVQGLNISLDGSWIGYRKEARGAYGDVILQAVQRAGDTVSFGEPMDMTQYSSVRPTVSPVR